MAMSKGIRAMMRWVCMGVHKEQQLVYMVNRIGLD